MLRLLLIFFFFAISANVLAQMYKPIDEGSKVHFTIKNFGIDTGGDLAGLAGEIIFNPSNVRVSSFDVSVEVKTIDTDNDSRDGHLRGKAYFDAETFPLISIKSTRINRTNKSGQGWFHFTGTLTMHGITKPIVFPFRATKKGDDYLFVGGFSINRLDYGVGKRSATISDNLKVSMKVLARKS